MDAQYFGSVLVDISFLFTLIYSCDVKADLSAVVTTVFSVELSFWKQKSYAQEFFLNIIMNVENTWLLNIFWKPLYLILWWIESQKEPHLFEMEIFCIFGNIFTLSLDYLNMSLLNY